MTLRSAGPVVCGDHDARTLCSVTRDGPASSRNRCTDTAGPAGDVGPPASGRTVCATIAAPPTPARSPALKPAVPLRPDDPAGRSRPDAHRRALDIERHDTPVPESFLVLYPSAGRARSSHDWQAVVDRHAFCEDLVQGLAELARAQRDDLGLTRHDVLDRVGRGVQALDPPLPPGEADWVQWRLVELLGWDREGR